MQRMLIVRSLRPDRVSFCVTSFVMNNLGTAFVEPPVLSMVQVVEDSNCHTPLIFVLSPGVVRHPTITLYCRTPLIFVLSPGVVRHPTITLCAFLDCTSKKSYRASKLLFYH
jgi:formaldehyde-activating enzyme involved in methanogenesis